MKPTAAGSLGQQPTAAFLACLAFVTALTAACIARPLYNWDMLAYMATALAYRDADSVRVHREVYDTLRAVAPPAKLEPLIGPVPHPYREDVYRNAEHFTQQLPFYSVKPAFPFLIFLLGLTGMNLATASIAVAAVGYGAACLLLFAWLRAARVPPWAALVATAILALGPPFVMLGRIATPDSLYLALFVLSALLLLERRRPHAAMLVLLAAMLARPNGIIWYGMVGFYLTFLAPPDLRISRAACGAYAVASFVLFEVLQIASGNYPWTVHFHHSWIEHLPSPATFVPTLTLPDYLRFYVARIPYFLAGELPFFVLLALAGFLARRALRVPFRDDVPAHFLLASIPFFVLHWALYPGQLDRMYAPQYWLIAGIALAATALPREARTA